ncbi:MAG: DUF692 domain-containing protein [Pseudomonadota bacterium]
MSAEPSGLGFGLGLRSAYYDAILEQSPAVDWFEIVSENYLVEGGKALYYLDAIAERYPLVMHGVSLSIGGPHALDSDYLRRLKSLAERVQPAWISDHLCWSRGSAHQLHDLLPLPYTEESLRHVADRVRQVQDVLGRPLVLENVSSYLRTAQAQFSEWEFLAALSELSGCELLLDLNNVYVSAHNHGFDPWTFISALPASRIRQLHLAGDPVWQLYQRTLEHLGPVATLLERDDHFPPLAELLTELDRARALAQLAHGGTARCA